jgi:hypothetical protein
VEVEVSADDADPLGRLVGTLQSMSLRLPIRQHRSVNRKGSVTLPGILRRSRDCP